MNPKPGDQVESQSLSSKKNRPRSKEATAGNLYIVGIGASAGGLQAFEQLFRALPSDSGIAFVVVQHLSAPHKSILPEILQRYTGMPVAQVTGDVDVLPNQVYVIPPGSDLALDDGRLLLLKSEKVRGQHLPIDHFFLSMSKNYGPKAIGVVLSGTGSDGSLGLKAIKAEGGLTVAQAPESAEYADMPRNAIATQEVDFILPPEKIGELIVNHIRHQKLEAYKPAEHQLDVRSAALQKLYFMLRSKTGHDFSMYKQATLLRRIDRRMKILHVRTVDEYIGYLEQNTGEIKALFEDMLINVTHFFRDPEAFEAVTQKVIRPLIDIKTANHQPLRVWVPGCSSGEEAYSIGILIYEQMDAMGIDLDVQIFATDLDINSIENARKGMYSSAILENVSDERLQRYFQKENEGYQIKKKIRDLMIFSTQNIISDPVFSKIDFISCRNLLIYLEHELQNLLFHQFHYSLNPDGFLFLGTSESVSSNSELFLTIDRKNKIYQRKETSSRYRLKTKPLPLSERKLPAETGSTDGAFHKGNLREWTEKNLLAFHAPACVVIDQKHNILYIHGRTGMYLEPVAGETNSDLVRMSREGLKTSLATALYAAGIKDEVIHRQGVKVKTNGDFTTINLTVRSLDGPPGYGKLFLVVFEPVPGAPSLPLDAEDLTARSDEAGGSIELMIYQLQKELKEKDEYLHTIIDELETTNHDLKSTNEELQSINEEMQSTNEELETSKEELQSINEELTTTNNELQTKNEELSGVNNDIHNLLACIEIGMIFLDLDLRIRRFTPSINRIYSLFPSDIGRPIGHFISTLNYNRLIADVKQVLRTLVPKAVEVQTNDGTWYLVNIRTYRTTENVIDGVVITFVDVTEQKQGDVLRRLGAILRDSNDAITLQDFAGNILAWNRGAENIYGWNEQEALSMNVMEMVKPDKQAGLAALYRLLAEGEDIRPFETQRITRDGRVVDIWITMTVMFNDEKKPIGVATTETNITERHQDSQSYYFENRALKALNAWYQAIQKLSQPVSETLADTACRVIVNEAGYRLAWVGLTGNPDEPVTPIVWPGKEAGQPAPQVTTEQDAIQRALESNQPVVVRSSVNPHQQPGENGIAPASQRGAFIVLPLNRESKPAGVLVIYADEPGSFAPSENKPLMELAGGLCPGSGH